MAKEDTPENKKLQQLEANRRAWCDSARGFMLREKITHFGHEHIPELNKPLFGRISFMRSGLFH